MINNNEKCGVSVWLITYNHADYIEDCLKGVINQAVDFPYEIIVHDDASTDGTTEIVKRYASEYPDLIKPIIQLENQYCKPGDTMIKSLIEKTSGRYVALCEGDDAWIDDNKIKKQYNWMETHSECSMCSHASNIQLISTGEVRPFSSFTTEDPVLIDIETLAREGEIFHTSSYFIRTSVIEDVKDFLTRQRVDDFAARLLYATRGLVGYLPDVMSLYRKGTKESWTSKMEDKTYKKEYNKYAIDLLNKLDEYTEHKFTKYIKCQGDGFLDTLPIDTKNN